MSQFYSNPEKMNREFRIIMDGHCLGYCWTFNEADRHRRAGTILDHTGERTWVEAGAVIERWNGDEWVEDKRSKGRRIA